MLEPMLDPVGSVLVELRDSPFVECDRIRVKEPDPGDAQPSGKFQRFVILDRLSVPPDPFVPVTDARLGVRCYGTTPQDAAALFGEVVAALHRRGPRQGTGGVWIYRSKMEASGGAASDPDTGQPFESGTIQLFATTQVVTTEGS